MDNLLDPLGFMFLTYLFETYLDLCQHSALKLPTLPKILEGVISQEKIERSRAYSLDKSRFHFVHKFVTFMMDSTIVFYGVLPWFWKKSGDYLVLTGLDSENETLHTLAFLFGFQICSLITRLPFSIYSAFVIEARHGFNKEQISLFIWAAGKWYLVYPLLGSPSVAILIAIVQCKNNDEIVAVVAHELGHLKLNHSISTFMAVQMLSALQFGGYSLVIYSKALGSIHSLFSLD